MRPVEPQFQDEHFSFNVDDFLNKRGSVPILHYRPNTLNHLFIEYNCNIELYLFITVKTVELPILTNIDEGNCRKLSKIILHVIYYIFDFLER